MEIIKRLIKTPSTAIFGVHFTGLIMLKMQWQKTQSTAIFAVPFTGLTMLKKMQRHKK